MGRGAGDLTPRDFRKWAPLLREKLLLHAPRIAWFHGKVAYENYLRHAEGVEEELDWGGQARTIGRCRVFVTPNPSAANASFSLENLVAAYNDLAGLREAVTK
ncbi:MAG: uracil-DNA glycosylase family protein [Terriglobales bacterium]